MSRILLLSNGHGEDLSGALLAEQLFKIGHKVSAIPLVGKGHHYQNAKIPLLTFTKEFSTGGIGYTSLRGRLTELIQGQPLYLLRMQWCVIRSARRFDLIVVVGDVIPIIAAWFTHRPVVTYLVAYSSYYEGKLKLPWPCGLLLKSKKFKAIFSRDELTAIDLSQQLIRPVQFLGNPFMDPVLTSLPQINKTKPFLGILPGSRRPELEENLLLVLRLIEIMPTSLEIRIEIALVQALNDASLKKLIMNTDWRLEDGDLINQNSHTIKIRRNAFNSVLQHSDLLIGMAGTAIEQAVGVGKPVVQLPGRGPQFTPNFAEAQRRLLGPNVFCAEGTPGSIKCIKSTANMIRILLRRIRVDPQFQQQCYSQAAKRLGSSGGTNNIAHVISKVSTNTIK